MDLRHSIRKHTPNLIKTWLKSSLGLMGVAVREIEPTLFDFLGNVKVETFLDIGAYVGDFTRQIRRLHPNAMIYALEPHATAYSALMLEMSADKMFAGYNVAVAEKEGFRDLHVMSHQYANSLLELDPERSYVTEIEQTNTIQVRTTSLDAWAAGKAIKEPVLLKADVQGMEEELIRGGISTLARVSIAVLEVSFQRCYSGQPLFEDVYRLMYERGFRLRGFYDVATSRTTKRQLWGDALFVKA